MAKITESIIYLVQPFLSEIGTDARSNPKNNFIIIGSTMIAPHRRHKIMMTLLLYLCFKKYVNGKHDIYMSLKLSSAAKNRRKKTRPTWDEVNLKISDTHFRRMFRMSRECFNSLCNVVIRNISEEKFKSEKYINAFYKQNYQSDDRAYIMYTAHMNTSGGYISGEVKLALTIRMLAGGNPLDLSVIFDISRAHCKTIFIDVLVDWIIGINIGKMDIASYMNDDEAMRRVALGFSERSSGVLRGAIGTIDVWLVKIQRPWKHRDNVTDPASFFSRKGFYALNVQCMVDDKKECCGHRFLTEDPVMIPLVSVRVVFIMIF